MLADEDPFTFMSLWKRLDDFEREQRRRDQEIRDEIHRVTVHVRGGTITVVVAVLLFLVKLYFPEASVPTL